MSAVLLLLVLASQAAQGALPSNAEAERPVAADTVVVCPAAFREAMRPWIEYRTQQGHSLAILSNLGTTDDIRRQIGEVAKGGRLHFVVLVGDAMPGAVSDPERRQRCVPLHYARARVNVLWGSEPQIATDHCYADLHGTSDAAPQPELAVGRLTADTPQQLQQIVAKILAYERTADYGLWRQRLNVVAGMGGFSPLADAILESAARYLLTENVPAVYHLSMTYGSWRSPYCPDPRQFHQTTLERLNEGACFWVYIGHGSPLSVDRIHVPGGEYPILSAADARQLQCRHGAPIALFLACYAGAIDARQTCLAEEMLRAPGGPVAIVAGSRVTMPYAMSLLATGLMKECFRNGCDTLGDAVLHAKQSLLKEPASDDRQRAVLDAIAAAISPAPQQLAAERAEHVLIFNLIGDPLLRLHHPRTIDLQLAPTAAAGAVLTLRGRCPVDGRGTLELVVHRDRLTFAPPDRSVYPQSAEALADLQETYRRANDPRLASVELPVQGGRFSAQLAIPAAAAGPCHVCLFVQGDRDCAVGSADVNITAKAALPK